MSDELPTALRAPSRTRLRGLVAGASPDPTPAAAPPGVPLGTGWLKHRLKAIVERGIAWYVSPTSEDAARRAADDVYERIQAERTSGGAQDPAALAVEVELLRAEVAALRRRLDEDSR